MPSIYELIPDHELLLNLEPEELAGVILEYLKSLPEGSAELNRYHFSLPHTVADYPQEHQGSISRALMGGWVCLEAEPAGPTWSAEALSRLERIPSFVRPMAKMGIETFARDNGYAEITAEVMDAARGSFPSQF